MAVQVLPQDLPAMLPVLKEHLPGSISVHMPISLITRGLTGYDVYVDRWPEFRFVFVKPDKEAFNDPDHEKVTYVYNLEDIDDTVVRDLFVKSGVLSQPTVFIPGAWWQAFEKVKEILCTSTESSFVEHMTETVPVFCCTVVSQLPELPKGYFARSLRYEDYETIITGVWYKDFDYVKSLKRLLALGALNIGIENPSGQLVAWTLQHVTGLLEMTYVIPEHRNKKLGKYVTVALTQKMIAQDGFCMAGIEEGNSVSVALHERVGFTKMDQPIHFGAFYQNGYAASMEHLSNPPSTNKNWK